MNDEQLVRASEADSDLGFMERLLALCCLPRTNPGTRFLYKRVNGPLRSSRDLLIPLRRPAGLAKADHPGLADEAPAHPICQEEL